MKGVFDGGRKDCMVDRDFAVKLAQCKVDVMKKIGV